MKLNIFSPQEHELTFKKNTFMIERGIFKDKRDVILNCLNFF